jgi:hypothetical protein
MIHSPPRQRIVRMRVIEEVEGNLIGGMNPARLKVTS